MAETKFHKQLVLYKYFLSLFKSDDFSKLKDTLKDPELENLDEDNITKFHKKIVFEKLHSHELTKDQLLRYDQNIVKHTFRINRKREEKIKWKYYQYLGLLFTEIYLDRYFAGQDKLLASLNEFLEGFNSILGNKEQLKKFEMKDLSKLAFWSATGSGKTLLMHVNILQYLHYAKKQGTSRDINKVILLTPNEGLSNQHKLEFDLSDLNSQMFSGDLVGQLGKEEVDTIEIIDIHKIKDEQGIKTVSIEAFEGNNLVLVDEGHRGSSGYEWKEKRDRLCEEGFSFEYSATFGQAIGAATAGKKETLRQEYAKCILFDYSYKFFYEDGYGKDYKIYNMPNDNIDEQRELYLTASLLSFYQQVKYFYDNNENLKPFRIEKPLWIFVGGRVTAVRTENKRKTSDVVDILLFIAEFIQNRSRSIDYLERLLSGRSGMLNPQNKDLFEDNFGYLNSKSINGEKAFTDILKTIFYTTSADVQLHIDNLKGIDGEIGLRAGDNEYFGVINVGDVKELLKLCEDKNLSIDEKDFSNSLFAQINNKDSQVNLLIGSKKFTEGWNSWRVSSMGLMNIGKKEGTEIIQLFGRGVRLKGYNLSLKRSSEIPEVATIRPKLIELIETLNIFGVRSDYMSQFQEYLEQEGIPTEKPEEIILPTIESMYRDKYLSALRSKKLKTLQVKDGLNFKKNGPNPVLDLPTSYLKNNKVVLDWYPRLQVIESRSKNIQMVDNREMHFLTENNVGFLDYTELYFELQDFKNERSWYNINITKEKIKELLLDNYWYKLYIPKEELEFSSDGFKDAQKWQEIAVILLRKYLDKYYKYKKKEWELPNLEYVEITESSMNVIEQEYKFEIHKDEDVIIEKIKLLKEAIEKNELEDLDFRNFTQGKFVPIGFNKHLFNPLIHLKKGTTTVKVKPVHLNDGEIQFIEKLKNYIQKNIDLFKETEICVLRNKSTKDGVGFFEADNFHPDFIVWLLVDGKQYITFVDPKGLRNLKGTGDVKIEFHKKIKEIQGRLSSKEEDIELNSFIISVTPYEEVDWWDKGISKADFNSKNVLFMEDENNKAIEQMIRIILTKS